MEARGGGGDSSGSKWKGVAPGAQHNFGKWNKIREFIIYGHYVTYGAVNVPQRGRRGLKGGRKREERKESDRELLRRNFW